MPQPARVLALLVALAATGSARPVLARGPRRAATQKAAPRRPATPKVIPNQQGKVVMFPFRDDDDSSVFAQIQRLLQSKGLEVMTGVRPVDTAEQYREMATTMGLVAYVDGSYHESAASARVTVRLRSGYTGRKVAEATFKDDKLHLRAEIEDKLWTKLGPAIARVCSDADKPRKRGRGPLVIDAGTPIASDGNSGRR
jgi:hypothetical protein